METATDEVKRPSSSPPSNSGHRNSHSNNQNRSTRNCSHRNPVSTASASSSFVPQRTAFFPAHLSSPVITERLHNGSLISGQLRICGSNGFVKVNSVEDDLFIAGNNRNRAFDGDQVAVLLIPPIRQQQCHQKYKHQQQKQQPTQQQQQQSDQDIQRHIQILKISEQKQSVEEEVLSSHSALTSTTSSPSPSPSPLPPSTSSPLVQLDSPVQVSNSQSTNTVSPVLLVPDDVDELPQYHGRVVGIIKSAHVENIVGYLLLQLLNSHLALFIPLDKKYPFAVIRSRDWPLEFMQEQINQGFQEGASTVNDVCSTQYNLPNVSDSSFLPILYVASYQPWTVLDRLPSCSITSTIGPTGHLSNEVAAALYQYQIDYDRSGEFPPAVGNQMQQFQLLSPSSADLNGRADLRHLCCFTMDPSSARDLDDALSIEFLSPTLYRIGVHVADVSHFVESGTPLDIEAFHRATTVYLVDKAIPMLPRLLSEKLCSLQSNVDRLTYSVFIVLDDQGEVQEDQCSITKSIIHSCARLDYETGQGLINLLEKRKGQQLTPLPLISREEVVDYLSAHSLSTSWLESFSSTRSVDELIQAIDQLNTVTILCKSQRFQQGAIQLDNVRLSFHLDEKQHPRDFYLDEGYGSNRLVAECMLLANMLVARTLLKYLPSHSLLRQHSPPIQRAMKKVASKCRKHGFPIDITSNRSLQQSLNDYQNRSIGNQQINARYLLEPLCTKPMTAALYVCSGNQQQNLNNSDAAASPLAEFYHYGLACEAYTHWTSPIRRYADLTVHRLLNEALINKAALETSTISTTSSIKFSSSLSIESISAIGTHCNQRRMNAKKLRDFIDRLYLIALLESHYSSIIESITFPSLASSASTASPALIEIGIITDIGSSSLEVLVPRLGIERRIQCNRINVDMKRINTRQELLTAPLSSSPALSHVSSALLSFPSFVLHIDWCDGLSEYLRSFDSLKVQLLPKLQPQMELELVIVHPSLPTAVVQVDLASVLDL